MKSTRPSRNATPFTGRRSRRQFEPDEVDTAYEAAKKARAAKLANMAEIHARVARGEPPLGKD